MTDGTGKTGGFQIKPNKAKQTGDGSHLFELFGCFCMGLGPIAGRGAFANKLCFCQKLLVIEKAVPSGTKRYGGIRKWLRVNWFRKQREAHKPRRHRGMESVEGQQRPEWEIGRGMDACCVTMISVKLVRRVGAMAQKRFPAAGDAPELVGTGGCLVSCSFHAAEYFMEGAGCPAICVFYDGAPPSRNNSIQPQMNADKRR